MEYSEIVVLTKYGFHIPEKLLHPVGTYDGSRCWGTTIPNIGYDIGLRDKEQPVNQILLSPVPFNSWACTIRIQARIKDEPGKLKSLFETLANPRLCANIISVSENTSGYYNGRVNILVEIYDLRDKAKNIQSINVKDPNKLRAITGYSVEVLLRVLEIKESIEQEDAAAEKACVGSGFLYHPDKDTGGCYLWSDTEKNSIIKSKLIQENKENALEDEFKFCSVNALSCQWLRTQAMCYLYSLVEQPLRFDYALNEKLLKSSIQGECSSRSIAQSFNLNFPAMFLATFHPMSKYIRLVSLQDDNHQKQLVKIGYKYTCVSDAKVKDKDISNNGSNGLLCHLTKELAISAPFNNSGSANYENLRRHEKFVFNIKNIISYSKRESRRFETGAIEILGFCDGISHPCLEYISREINSRIGGFEKIIQQDVKRKIQFNETIEISFANPYRIFLSCREEIKKDKTFRSIFERVARKYGVKIEISDESAEIVTSDVLNRFSSVDALIIIFSITDTEHQEYMQATDKTRFNPNLGWLLFELGIGMGKKMPTVQLRDITVVTKEQWTQWVSVGKDTSLCFIDRKKPDQMEVYLEGAIRVILGKLSSSYYL